MERPATIARALLALNLLLAGAIVGYVVGHPYPFQSGGEPAEQRQNLTPTTTSGIPPELDAEPIQPGAYTVRFSRPHADTGLLGANLHDPMLVRENETLYLVATARDDEQVLYRTHVDSPYDWTLVDHHYLSSQLAFDSMVEVNGTYIAYGNREIYTAGNLSTDDWTQRRTFTLFANDLGAYYDGERVHIYYERNTSNTSKYSGREIGHASSPDGITNWTRHPSVWRAPPGYGVGDFEVVAAGDRLFIFGDYSREHPQYSVGVWVNDDAYTEFTKLEEPAVAPRGGDTGYGDEYGVGDPAVVRLPDGRYLLVANGHGGPDQPAELHAYLGTIAGPTIPNASTTTRRSA